MQNSTPTVQNRCRRLWPQLLFAFVAPLLGLAITSSVLAQTATGPTLISGYTDPNLDLSDANGTFLITEYYGQTSYGNLQVSNILFVNGNARMPAGIGISAGPNPAWTGDNDATNFSKIVGGDDWLGSTMNFSIPTTVGHTYELQLIFYDNYVSAANGRVFGLAIDGTTINNSIDLYALGAGKNSTHAVLFTYTFTASAGSLPIQLTKGYIQNPEISALLLKDLSNSPIPPVITATPQNQTNFTTGTIALSGAAAGSPTIGYNWAAGPVGGGSYTLLSDDGVNILGSGTSTLTISNLTSANQASYVLIATNLYGSATSVPVTLTVLSIPTPPVVVGTNFAYFIMTNNPIAYWRLNDSQSAGMIYDSSGNGFHLNQALTNAAMGVAGPQTPDYPGFEDGNTGVQTKPSTVPNGWLQGSRPLAMNNYVNASNNYCCTILAWMNPAGNQPGGAGIIVGRIDNNSGVLPNNLGFAYNTKVLADGDVELGWLWNGQDYQVDSSLEVPHNIWSLCAMVVTTTNTTLYVCNTNGIKSFTSVVPASGNQYTAHNTAPTWNGTTYIGYDSFAGARRFNGMIDEAAILPVALSADQMLALYASAEGKAGVHPQIPTQPLGCLVGDGATKTLTAVASGNAPLDYQWQFQGTDGNFVNLTDGINIVGNQTNWFAGSLTTALTITNFNTSVAGNYRLVVTNSVGSVTSSIATLLVNPIVRDGSYTYLVYSNNPYAYWRLNETNGSSVVADSSPAGGFNGGALANAGLGAPGLQAPAFPGFSANNTAMAVNRAQPGTGYALLPNLNLVGVNTLTMTLWVNPNTTKQAAHTALLELQGTGDGGLNYSANYIDASGNPTLGYTWGGGNGSWNTGLVPPAGMWSFISLVVTPTDATMYMFNANGITSSRVVINNAATTFLGLGAIGTDAFYTPNWNGICGVFDGAISDVAIFKSALNGSTLETLYGTAAGISSFPAVVTQNPVNVAVAPGATAKFSAATLGTGLSYQWQVLTNGVFVNLIDGGQISGALTTSLTISNATIANMTQYQLVVVNNLGSITSLPAKLLINTPLPPALIGEWITGSEDLGDKSGFTPGGVHDGMIWGGPNGGGNLQFAPQAPPGYSGSSLYLDGGSAVIISNTASGDSDYRLTFDNNINTKFSVAFWAQGYPSAGWYPWVGKGGENGIGWEIRLDANGGGLINHPTFTMRGLSNDDGGNGAPINCNTPNAWHHYTGVFDGTKGIRQLYVDGVLQLNLFNIFGVNAVASADHLTIGALQDPAITPPRFFYGLIYDVRMYSYALNASEVQALVNPPQPAGSVQISLGNPSIQAGQSESLTVSLPVGTIPPATVWITNNAPGVATIRGATGNVFAVTFPAGGPLFQTFTLDTLAAGSVSFSFGNSLGLGSADMVNTTVNTPQMVGRWLTGSADFADKSGYMPAGTHDGFAYGPGGPINLPNFFANDVPAGYTGQSLQLDGNYLVAIHNSSTLEGGYQPTFDATLANGFTAAFWAKANAVPLASWSTWIGKRGEDIVGWKIRSHGTDNSPSFTMRSTTGAGDTFTSSFRIDTNWHHYIATWDSFTGTRKMYIDGKLDFTQPNSFGPQPTPQIDYLTIGGFDNNAFLGGLTPSAMFVGKMFDVRMYDYALTASEAQALAHPVSGALVAAASQPVIDKDHAGKISVSLPDGANASSPVTVWVTNLSPSVISIDGAAGNVFSVTFAAGAYSSQQFTITGLSEGQVVVGFGATGLTTAFVTNAVYAPGHLVGRWIAGAHSLTEISGFNPGVHNGFVMGSTPANFSYSADVPPGFAGVSVDLANANNANTVGIAITNTAMSDSAYAPTFDDVIKNKFTIACWAKLDASYSQGWVNFASKRGEDNYGWQIRRSGGNPINDAFTLRGSTQGGTYGSWDDTVGSVDISSAGVWRHITAVYDGYAGTRQMYVNGVLDNSVNRTNDFGPYTMAKNHHMVIGGRENNVIIGAGGVANLDNNLSFNGKLYDVRVYNYAITGDQVQSLLKPTGALTVNVISPGVIQLSWPAGAGYILQSSASVTGTFENSDLSATTVDGMNVVTIDITQGGSTQFYRLY